MRNLPPTSAYEWYLRTHPRQAFGTCCSGTDSPVLAVDLVRLAVEDAFGVAWAPEHKFTAKITKRKRELLFSRQYDRVEAVRPEVNGSRSSADNAQRKRPLGAVPRWLESRLLQAVNDASLMVVMGPCEALGSFAASLWQSSLG